MEPVKGRVQDVLRRRAHAVSTGMSTGLSTGGVAAALRRPGARARWLAVIVAVLLLCSAPALVSAFPVSTPSRSVVQWMQLVLSSKTVPHSGLVESRGTLNLPDVDTVRQDVITLLGDRTRLRVWQAAPDRYRVDRITPYGEQDTYVTGRRTLTWESNERRLTREVAPPQFPQPAPPDVLPTSLGYRLLEAMPWDGRGVQLGNEQRVAGRATIAMTWHPNDPRSLVGQVRMWIDAENGLPLQVEMKSTTSDLVAFETRFLDLSLTPPSDEVLRFDARHTPRIDIQNMPPPAPQDLTPQYVLPTELAGLPRRSDARPFLATYGQGVSVVSLIAFDSATADSIRQQIDSPGRPPYKGSFGEGTLIEAPMLRGLIFSSGERGYALAGTVTLDVLQQIAQQLVDNPPDRTGQ